MSKKMKIWLFSGLGALAVLAIALGRRLPLTGHGAVNWLTALGMAVFCTLLGHSVFSWALRYLPPAFISTVKLLEPVFASVWGLCLFGERPGALTVLGGAVIIAGVALYSRADGEKRKERMTRS